MSATSASAGEKPINLSNESSLLQDDRVSELDDHPELSCLSESERENDENDEDDASSEDYRLHFSSDPPDSELYSSSNAQDYVFFPDPRDSRYKTFSQFVKLFIPVPQEQLEWLRHSGNKRFRLKSKIIYFTTTEQYFQFAKAFFFDDQEIGEQILAAETGAQQKRLGRRVRGFDKQGWDDIRFEVAIEANYLKFTQYGELRRILVETGERVICETRQDKEWGIGFIAMDAMGTRLVWGKNLLGKALMKVRRRFQEEDRKRLERKLDRRLRKGKKLQKGNEGVAEGE
jgi:ribA/ribD-fused uncharacterized protein